MKIDVEDFIVLFSILIIVLFNVDFDGDCLNIMILLDNYMVESMVDFVLYKSVLNLEIV